MYTVVHPPLVGTAAPVSKILRTFLYCCHLLLLFAATDSMTAVIHDYRVLSLSLSYFKLWCFQSMLRSVRRIFTFHYSLLWIAIVASRFVYYTNNLCALDRRRIVRSIRWNELLNPLNPELNPICYLLALLGAHRFLHVSRIRVKLLTFRLLMSYIYEAPILDVSRSHTTTQHSR